MSARSSFLPIVPFILFILFLRYHTFLLGYLRGSRPMVFAIFFQIPFPSTHVSLIVHDGVSQLVDESSTSILIA